MRILFITGSPPYPTNIGGNQLAAQRVQALASQGEVDLFLAVDENDLPAAHVAEIRKNFRLVGLMAPARRGQLGLWRLFRPLAPDLVDRAADLLASRRRDYRPDPLLAPALKRLMAEIRYDVVVGGGLDLAMKTGISPDFPFVLDVNDTEQEWFKSQIESPCSGWFAKRLAAWRLSQLKNFVPDLYRRFRQCWVIKPRDVQVSGLEHAVWLGMPYRQPEGGLPPLATSDPASRAVIMLGSYYHRPNAEGLDWFVKRVWPMVRAEVPDAEFRVIGPGLPARRAEAYGCVPGVRVMGTVPSVVSHYRECAISIAPIWTGAGINIKVMESYAYGRTCIRTPYAHRGYEECLDGDESDCVAASPEAFAHACIDLLRDPVRRDRLTAASYPRVMREFSPERITEVVAANLQTLDRARASDLDSGEKCR